MKTLLLFRTSSRLLIITALAIVGAAGVACDGGHHDEDFPEVDCGVVEVKGYAEMTVWASCTSCHSFELSGAERRSAPAGVNYDTYEGAMADPEHAAVEVASGSMPPADGVSDAEKDELYAWVRCGMPP